MIKTLLITVNIFVFELFSIKINVFSSLYTLEKLLGPPLVDIVVLTTTVDSFIAKFYAYKM